MGMVTIMGLTNKYKVFTTAKKLLPKRSKCSSQEEIMGLINKYKVFATAEKLLAKRSKCSSQEENIKACPKLMKKVTTSPSPVKNNSTANTPAPSRDLTALKATSVASSLVFHFTLAGDLTM